ncbi:MAG: hypothetical protein WCA36_11655 [Pseudolabrys sp.]|jgi:hypothetical protein
MKLGIAFVLVMAFPTMASAQYAFQLRPSPYRILSGWEQSANTYRTQSIEHVTRTATPVSDRAQAGHVGIQRSDNDVTGGINHHHAPRY